MSNIKESAQLIAYRTYKGLKKASPLSEDQRYKFANYVAGRSVSTPRGAALLLEAATAIADEEVN